MRSRPNGTGSKQIIADVNAGAAMLRKEAAELARDADRLHKEIGRVHVAADRLHHKIEVTHGRIRTYRSLNRLRCRKSK
jgi:uncharacterized coiled-coil DUF342 family protein